MIDDNVQAVDDSHKGGCGRACGETSFDQLHCLMPSLYRISISRNPESNNNGNYVS